MVFAGLVGIPEAAEAMLAKQQYDDVLDLPDMQFRTLSATSGVSQPGCSVVRSTGGRSENAYPARRIVETAKGFGDNSALS